MKGTEKIIAHIRADGDAEAKKIIDAASKQAEEKRAESFKAAASGMEEIVLNARDKAEVGKAVCKAANELLSAKGTPGKLTVSEDTADISGGVIVRFGGIETNCSIDALIRQRRSGLSTEVAASLFE